MAAKTKKEVIKETPKKETEMDKIRKMSDKEINDAIEANKKELFGLRFQAAVGKLENSDRISKAKKSIARMKTVQTERANAVK